MRQSFKPMTFRLAHSWRDLRLSDQSLCHFGSQFSGVAYRVLQYHYLATLPRACVLNRVGVQPFCRNTTVIFVVLHKSHGQLLQSITKAGLQSKRCSWAHASDSRYRGFGTCQKRILLFLFHSPLTITMWEFLLLIKNAEWVSLILASATAHIFVCDHRPKTNELLESLFTIWFIASFKWNII